MLKYLNATLATGLIELNAAAGGLVAVIIIFVFFNNIDDGGIALGCVLLFFLNIIVFGFIAILGQAVLELQKIRKLLDLLLLRL